MKSISAYRAEDGTLHETHDGAAVADLMTMGFGIEGARKILDRRTDIERLFREVSGIGYIPAYYPDLSGAAAEGSEAA
ncbi:hypothetical protein [Pseudogemmobacter sonorensis]|uniref:hypothetical protein n=1 Tax=Pseudogemmobacter sonorensis TaxID=2989681 RepID=UPI00367DA57C